MRVARFADSQVFVQFSVTIKGERISCWISEEALSDHFGGTGETRVRTLVRHLDEIIPVAAGVARRTPTGEPILVKTEHFQKAWRRVEA
jgi:hypothetical protein